MCMTRSNVTKNCEPAMNGVAITTSSEVVKFAHTSSGMRQNVMPGARIVMIVTRKLRAVMIEDAPAHWTAIVKKTVPIGWCTESGGDCVPPVADGPPRPGEPARLLTPAARTPPKERAVRTGGAQGGGA